MNYDRYNICFYGEIIGSDVEGVKRKVQKKYKLTDEVLKTMFSGDEIVFERNAHIDKAVEYINKLEDLGLKCYVQKATYEKWNYIERDKSENQPTLYERVVTSKIFLLLFLSIFYVFVFLVSYIFEDISILAVSMLCISIILSHQYHRIKYSYKSLVPNNFWSINRKVGLIITFVCFVFYSMVGRLFPNLNFAYFSFFHSDVPGAEGNISSTGPMAGVEYTLLLPILSILCMCYYDLLYTPKSENMRQGSDITALIVGFAVLIISAIIFLAFA